MFDAPSSIDNQKVSFPKLEEEVLKYWQDNHIFQKSIDSRSKDKEYVFYDGPPFATGLPHYGHLLASTIKDVIPRYQTMKGHRVERRFGWDTHGLPIEYEVESSLSLSGKFDIENKFGVANFCEECRKTVLRYTGEWEKTVNRIGRWVDFKNDYKTMDLSFMESVWWVFKQLWDKNLIYQGKRVVPYSAKISTPLSNFEAGQNYKDVQDPSVTVKVELVNEPGTFILVWTTTPWTLPSNLAVCVNANIDYVKILDKATNEKYILAQSRLAAYYKKPDEYEMLENKKGSALKEIKYKPLLIYFENHPNAFRVLNDDYVTTEDGTGVVHLAPAYGEDDYRVCLREKIELVDPINEEGIFTAAVPDLKGMWFKDADKVVLKLLKDNGKLVSQKTYQHSYPFCYRSDTPLMYKAIDAWYVSVEKIKDQMIKANDQIHWQPGHLKEGRFGNWLENAKDWNISRNRYWGTPLPIFKSADGEFICVGSVAELEKLSGQKVTDLHKHKIDGLELKQNGKTYKRIPEVLDCWFESGSMPYAQMHYPFENEQRFEKNFPAEFIAEGLDQTRGWFYTLVVLGAALYNKPPFKNVVVNGLILAEDGKKMSKRLKNYPAPDKVLNTEGADALRFYLMNSPVVKAESLKFSEAGIQEIIKKIQLPLWNAYSFFLTYARIDNWQPSQMVQKKNNPLDKWILSELQILNKNLTSELDDYDLQKATEHYFDFIESLTNWYIRRSRRRFWKSQSDSDKNEAYSTLYEVLTTFCLLMAPFMPFLSEAMYRNLTDKESVHLENWPEVKKNQIDEKLSQEFWVIRTVVSLGHQVRARAKIKVRQPLQKVIFALPQKFQNVKIDQQVIAEELNVKEVVVVTKADEIAVLKVSPNGKLLGPKYGKDVQEILKEAKAGNFEMLSEKSVKVAGKYILENEEVAIGYESKAGGDVASDHGIVVSIDTALNETLVHEGYVRDLVRFVQDSRKEAGFNVDDRIDIALVIKNDDGSLVKAIETNKNYLMNETLGQKIIFTALTQKDYEQGFEIEDFQFLLQLKKH
jgi:isoleucyl-tRNA synthetase